MTVIWLVRFRTRYPRPWARGLKRLSVGPSSTQARRTHSMPRSPRPPRASALAIALASTLPTGSLADCGANASTACASSAGSPRIRSTTRRAFRGVTRTNRAIALASINPLLSTDQHGLSPGGAKPRTGGLRGVGPPRGGRGGWVPPVRGGLGGSSPRDQLSHHSSWVRLATATPVVLDVRSESPRRRELAELVAHHRLGDEHRDVLPAVMHRDRVPKHGRDDHGTPGPRPDDGL